MKRSRSKFWLAERGALTIAGTRSWFAMGEHRAADVRSCDSAAQIERGCA